MDMSRAQARAVRMTARKFASAAEADRHDRDFWAAIPREERMVQVWRR